MVSLSIETLKWKVIVNISITFSVLLHLIPLVILNNNFQNRIVTPKNKERHLAISIRYNKPASTRRNTNNLPLTSETKIKRKKEILKSNKKLKTSSATKVNKKAKLTKKVENTESRTTTNGKLQKNLKSSSPDQGTQEGRGIILKAAKLINSSFTPPAYSDEALSSGVEGLFTLMVLVNQEGKALEAKLIDEIGYQMDQPLIQSVLNAKFTPAETTTGKTITSWVNISVTLQLD